MSSPVAWSRAITSLPIDRRRLEACAEQIAEAGRELGALGWTPATSSNFSMRLDASHAAVTISGRDKGHLGIDDIMVVDFDGGWMADHAVKESIRRIAMLGNHLPRQCGIATFTTDICEAVRPLR